MKKMSSLDKEFIKGLKKGLEIAKKICLKSGYDFVFPDVDISLHEMFRNEDKKMVYKKCPKCGSTQFHIVEEFGILKVVCGKTKTCGKEVIHIDTLLH